jgi:hypothetical protein
MTKPAVLSLVVLIGAVASAQQSSTSSFGEPPPKEPRGAAHLPARRVSFKPGRDLVVEARKSKDAVVEVVRESSPPFMGPSDDPLAEIETLTRLADAVSLVRIKGKRAELNARKDWVSSSAEGVVQEILKNSSTRPLAVGQKVSLRERGGEVTVEGRRIVASDAWARRTSIGREYLVFWAMRPDGSWTTFGEVYTFEREGTRWTRLLTTPRADAVGAMDSDRVLAEIRLVAHLPRPEGGIK